MKTTQTKEAAIRRAELEATIARLEKKRINND
jgi:hypothetical protein